MATSPYITRKEARDRGLRRYFTGKPCKNGHLSERHTSNTHCLACRMEAERKWRAVNPERVRARNDQYRLENRAQLLVYGQKYRKENKENIAAGDLAYRKKNRARARENTRRWRLENPEQLKLSGKRWREANPLAVRINWHNAKARKRSAPGRYTTADVERLFSEQSGRCWYCGETLVDYHIEHKTPLCRGGSNWPDNLCLSCPSCNHRKGSKTAEEFRRDLAMGA